MSSGWYKQQRNIPEQAWFKDADTVLLYTYLKATAYVTTGKYEGVVIRRGSCPTTRAEMMEATGLSYKKVDRCLRNLVAYGEIIVKGNNKFTIVTICDYDNLDTSESLFDACEEQPRNNERYNRGTATGTAEGTTHLLTIEGRRKKEEGLITPYSPYKNERESGDLALEVKKRYNKTFDGKLAPCIRLTLPTKVMVMECINRFGIQSVDLVFEQVLSEPFSLGQSKTGFIASFQYIFTPKRFQEYLERALLRLKKKAKPAEEPAGTAMTEEPKPTGSWLDEYNSNPNWRPEEKR